MAMIARRPRNRLSKEQLRLFRHQQAQRPARLDATSIGIICNCPSRRELSSTPLHRPSRVRVTIASSCSPSPPS